MREATTRLIVVMSIAVALSGVSPAQSGGSAETDQRNLLQRVRSLEAVVQRYEAERADRDAGYIAEISNLRGQVAKLQDDLDSGRTGSAAGSVSLEEAIVDLNDSITPQTLDRPWHENFDIWGFGAVGFSATGDAGTRPKGSFLVNEVTLFIDAEVWDDTSFFIELQIVRLGKDDTVATRTGEAYVHFRNIFGGDGRNHVGIKVGRVDIPFGEEYLSQDAIDNPLISFSAAYVYGFDEGIVFYGDFEGLGWIFAITEGSDTRSLDDDWDKAFNLKLHGEPVSGLKLSGSFMRQGKVGKSAVEFGGSHFQPVGASHSSTLGSSPNSKVEAYLYELDARYSFGTSGHVALSFGQAWVDDDDSRFDRDVLWFSIEGLIHLTPEIYLAARYSEIGTYDDDEGYHFDGKTLAGGNGAFGYDTKRFQRAAIALGWKPNPRVTLKLELGHDWFDVIDASTLRERNSQRWFTGLEIVVGF